MKLIHSFNQDHFLESVMKIDGWEEALEQGSCSSISVAFADFYFHSELRDLEVFFNYLDDHKAVIAEQQTNAIEWHRYNLTGYSYLLGQRNLDWQGPEYGPDTFSDYFYKGSFALCTFQFNDHKDAHTVAILSDPRVECDLIYTFDPNFGLYQVESDIWYGLAFMKFLNDNYRDVDAIAFKNIGIKLFND